MLFVKQKLAEKNIKIYQDKCVFFHIDEKMYEEIYAILDDRVNYDIEVVTHYLGNYLTIYIW